MRTSIPWKFRYYFGFNCASRISRVARESPRDRPDSRHSISVDSRKLSRFAPHSTNGVIFSHNQIAHFCSACARCWLAARSRSTAQRRFKHANTPTGTFTQLSRTRPPHQSHVYPCLNRLLVNCVIFLACQTFDQAMKRLDLDLMCVSSFTSTRPAKALLTRVTSMYEYDYYSTPTTRICTNYKLPSADRKIERTFFHTLHTTTIGTCAIFLPTTARQGSPGSHQELARPGS